MSVDHASRSEARYWIEPAERIREILGREHIPDTAELAYSFSGGYERLEYRESSEHGSLHFEGSYHSDGMCDGEHICSFCGWVHTL